MKKQLGMTLIELMISMVLGLAVIGSIGQLFIQSQKSFKLQRNLSDMIDDGTFALESIVKGMLLTGFVLDGNTSTFPAQTNVLNSGMDFSTGDVIKGITTTTGGKTDDQLIFRYKLGDSAISGTGYSNELDNFVCTQSIASGYGTTYLKGDMVTVYIYKKDTDNSNDIYKGIHTPVLYCQAKIDRNNLLITSTTAEPLISEVQHLEFKYGVKHKRNKTFYYTDAANMTGTQDCGLNGAIVPIWQCVTSVKITLVLRSVDDKVVREKMSYEVDGATYMATDYRLYKIFSKTVHLRTPGLVG